MLLRSLSAANFLRYREIAIPSFPPTGVVWIEAATPEDRDAFRELLGFALLGRPSGARADSTALIRDGADYAFVEIEFEHPAVGPVTVRRGLARGSRAPVSLVEGRTERLSSGEGEVASRLAELVGGDLPGFLRRALPPLAPAAPVARRIGDPEDVEGLVRARKRVRSRLRRARARWSKLEAGGDVRAEAEATSLEKELARIEDRAAPSIPPEVAEADAEVVRFGEALAGEAAREARAESARALTALAGRIVGGLRRAREDAGRLEKERADTQALLTRTAEYEGRLRELRGAMLGPGPAEGPSAAAPRKLHSLRPGLAMLGLALLLVAGLVLVNGHLPRGHWLLSILNPAIALFVLLDVWFALRVWREVDRQEETTVGPACADGDPVLMLESIEGEYADVIGVYDEALPDRLGAKLGDLDAREGRVGEAREAWEELRRTLDAEWERARAAAPRLPVDPSSLDAAEPGGDEPAMPSKEDVIAAVDALVAAAGPADREGAGPTREAARAAVESRIRAALRSVGDAREAEDLMRGAGITAVRASGVDRPERERRIRGLTKALRDELAALAAAAGPSPAPEAAAKKARLAELAAAASTVREVRARREKAEADLEEIVERLRIAREGDGPAGEPFLADVDGFVPEEGVVSVHRTPDGGFLLRKAEGPDVPVPADHGLSSLLLILRAIREGRDGHGVVPGFLVLDPTALPGPLVESRALLGFVMRAAPEVRQLVVTGTGGTGPAGPGLRIRPV